VEGAMMLSKKLQGIIANNVSLYSGPNEYTLHQSKHIPEREPALLNKLSEIKKFAERNHGECYAIGKPYITGDQLQVNFCMVCAIKACNEFENAIIVNI